MQPFHPAQLLVSGGYCNCNRSQKSFATQNEMAVVQDNTQASDVLGMLSSPYVPMIQELKIVYCITLIFREHFIFTQIFRKNLVLANF